MPGDSEAATISPIQRSPEDLLAMKRTREAAQRLDDDARAVVCWLDAVFPGLVISMEVQRHHSCEDNEIAHVEPRVTDRPRRREARDAAEKALTALGWLLKPEGRDVRSTFHRPSQAQSAHARLADIARVRRAVKQAHTTRSSYCPSTAHQG
ncbi:hypothetical protein [Sagittula sp.]|uniref:hypothetical protein n=1 Tax=Sagittula sp. TaxID=2038081 RepID=UPI003517E1A9